MCLDGCVSCWVCVSMGVCVLMGTCLTLMDVYYRNAEFFAVHRLKLCTLFFLNCVCIILGVNIVDLFVG